MHGLHSWPFELEPTPIAKLPSIPLFVRLVITYAPSKFESPYVNPGVMRTNLLFEGQNLL
jgi:hypothetical protein